MKRLMGSFAALIFVCGMLAFARVGWASTGVRPLTQTVPVPGDRWMEIDLYWFQQNDLQHSVDTFWDRFAPLYEGIQGDKGVILNVGWTVTYIMEWSGDLQQRLDLPRGTGQRPWVAETSPLAGTTAERQREWKERFAKPIIVQRQEYGPWRYADLKRLAILLRAGAERRGIHQFKVGSLVYAWDNAYGELAPWATRHPEAFTPVKGGKAEGHIDRYFDPGATLHADGARLGGLPHGIPEGMSVYRAFASQWGNLSRTVGLDALMLRDSFGFAVPYARGGPEGPLMPSPEAIQRTTDNVAALVRETKQSNPRSLLMMYSNGASAVGDWRSNGCDLEKIAKEGYLDIFVDQTWAGAWNEVGVRHKDFWNLPTLGWTYQLAYTLLHGAMLADTKVRHYPLVETFDAWESWDVLHTVPERLRWGIWAYSHAAVKTPHGIVMPEGSYISWANQGKRLLTEADVQFLSSNINDAVRDAAHTKEVFGPTLVYSRASMQWQADHATKDSDIKEWIDEQAGSIIKWPVPILSVTRLEWLGRIQSDLPILQTPSHLQPVQFEALEQRIRRGQPTAIFGSFADGVDPRLLKLAGEPAYDSGEPKAMVHQATAGASEGLKIEHVPQNFPIQQLLDRRTDGAHLAKSGAQKDVYCIDGSPQLLLVRDPKERLMLWDPPEFTEKAREPLRNIWGGSAAPYALAAASVNELLRDSGALHARTIDMDQTGTVGAWITSDGTLHLLFGNLEEGLREDADRSRHVTMEFPAAWRGVRWHPVWANSPSLSKADGRSLVVDLSPDSSMLLEAPLK